MGGGWLVLAAAFVAPVVAALAPRWEWGLRRALIVLGVLAILASLAWSVAWGAGLQDSAGLSAPAAWPISTIRFLLPAIGAGVVAVALGSRAPGDVGHAAIAVLAVGLVWSVVADARLGAPYTPRR
jgi:hypothetical protein